MGESFHQVVGQAEEPFSGASGPRQGGADLIGGELDELGLIGVGVGVGDGDGVGEEFSLEVGNLPGPRLQQRNLVLPGQLVPIDALQQHGQLRTGRPLAETFQGRRILVGDQAEPVAGLVAGLVEPICLLVERLIEHMFVIHGG